MNPAFSAENDPNEKLAEARRLRQYGKFSIQPCDLSLIGLDQQLALIRSYFATWELVVEKYLIPAAFKSDLRVAMIGKGWDGEYLYKEEDPVINAIVSEWKAILAKYI